MYKLLIVDDEDWIRERLKYTIDWGRLDIEVAGEASDGEIALEATGRLSPDIVITDIRMPSVDGLGYIKGLRERKNNAKVIILSGYSDFAYAQKALQLGAFDYILKPVEDDDLIATVKRCIREIEYERKKETILRRAQKQVNENKPLLKREFFMNLINDLYDSNEEMMNELAFIGVHYDIRNEICFIISLDEAEGKGGPESWDKRLLQFVVCNITQDFSSRIGSSETFVSHTGEIISLVFSDLEAEVLSRRVHSISGGIRKMMRKITGRSVTIGVGRVYGTLSEMARSYREAREALQYRSYLGKGKVYDIRSIELLHKPGNYRPVDLELLLNHIRVGGKDEALAVLDGIVKGMRQEGSEPSPIDLKLLYMDIFNSLFKTAMEVHAFNDFSELTYKFFEQLNRLQTIEEIQEWLEESVSAMIGIIMRFKDTRKRKVIEKALGYINSNFTQPITLNSVSEKFYLNASYFCKVFKDEMGESFTKYLTGLRLRKAKELLSDPTVKIYEIAGAVGYSDVQYFTKIFKSVLGVTPMQYREKIK